MSVRGVSSERPLTDSIAGVPLSSGRGRVSGAAPASVRGVFKTAMRAAAARDRERTDGDRRESENEVRSRIGDSADRTPAVAPTVDSDGGEALAPSRGEIPLAKRGQDENRRRVQPGAGVSLLVPVLAPAGGVPPDPMDSVARSVAVERVTKSDKADPGSAGAPVRRTAAEENAPRRDEAEKSASSGLSHAGPAEGPDARGRGGTLAARPAPGFSRGDTVIGEGLDDRLSSVGTAAAGGGSLAGAGGREQDPVAPSSVSKAVTAKTVSRTEGAGAGDGSARRKLDSDADRRIGTMLSVGRREAASGPGSDRVDGKGAADGAVMFRSPIEAVARHDGQELAVRQASDGVVLLNPASSDAHADDRTSSRGAVGPEAEGFAAPAPRPPENRAMSIAGGAVSGDRPADFRASAALASFVVESDASVSGIFQDGRGGGAGGDPKRSQDRGGTDAATAAAGVGATGLSNAAVPIGTASVIPGAGSSGLDVHAPAHLLGPDLARHIAAMVSAGRDQAVVRMDPPDLGTLTVRLDLHGRDLSVTFVTPHAAVQNALAGAMDSLRADLGASGLNLASSFVGGGGGQAGQRFGGAGFADGRFHVLPDKEEPAPAATRIETELSVYV